MSMHDMLEPKNPKTESPIQRKVDKVGIEVEFLKYSGYIEKSTDLITKGNILAHYENEDKFEGDGGHVEFITKESDNYSDVESRIRHGIGIFNQLERNPFRGYRLVSQGNQNIARPQVTMQISKDSLHDCVSSMLKGNTVFPKGTYKQPLTITDSYTKIPSKMKEMYFKNSENSEFGSQIVSDIDKLNLKKEQILSQHRIGKNQEEITLIEKDLTKAMDLASYSLIQIYFALFKKAIYFKGHFGFLSRTSLFSMYSALSPEQKDFYQKIFDLAKEDLYCKDSDISNAKNGKTSAWKALESTYKGGFIKNMEGTDVETDALSSDIVNGGRDSGRSIGAMPLPPEADAIIECRYLPYVDADPDAVINVVKAVVNQFDPAFIAGNRNTPPTVPLPDDES